MLFVCYYECMYCFSESIMTTITEVSRLVRVSISMFGHGYSDSRRNAFLFMSQCLSIVPDLSDSELIACFNHSPSLIAQMRFPRGNGLSPDRADVLWLLVERGILPRDSLKAPISDPVKLDPTQLPSLKAEDVYDIFVSYSSEPVFKCWSRK
jgi:hypothetical protein